MSKGVEYLARLRGDPAEPGGAGARYLARLRGEEPKVTPEEMSSFLSEANAPDPDVIPPKPPAPGGRDQVASALADLREKAARPDMAESAMRMINQGITLGANDEIQAGLGAGVEAVARAGRSLGRAVGMDVASDEGRTIAGDYRSFLNAQRKRDEQARDDHPIVAPLAEAAGGMIPLLMTGGASAPAQATAKTTAPLATRAVDRFGRIVAEGAAQGYGHSKADTTEGQLKDMAIGAATNVAVDQTLGRIIRRIIGGAPERAAAARKADLLSGDEGSIRAGSRAAQKVADRGDLLEEEWQQLPHLRQALRSPPSKALPEVKERAETLAALLPKEYAIITKHTAPQKLTEIQGRLAAKIEGVERFMRGDDVAAGAIPGGSEDLKVLRVLSAKLAEHASPDGTITPQALRRWTSNVIKMSDATIDSINPGVLTTAKRNAERHANDVLRDSLEAARQSASAKDLPLVDQALANIKAINRPLAGYQAAEEVLSQRLANEKNAKVASMITGTRGKSVGLGTMGLMGGVLGGHDPVTTAVAAGVGAGAPYVAKGGRAVARRFSEEVLEPLERAARAGKPLADLTKLAASTGVPIQVVRQIHQAWSRSKERKK